MDVRLARVGNWGSGVLAMTDKDNVWDDANRKRVGLLLVSAFPGAMVILWTVHGVRAIVASRYLYVAFYFSLSIAGVLLCCWLVSVSRFRSPNRRMTEVGVVLSRDSVVFRTSTKLRVGVAVASALATVASLVFAIGMWTNALSFPMLPGQRIAFPFLATAFAAMTIVIMLQYLIGRQRFPEIRCSPLQLQVDGKRSSQALSWDHIETIEPVVRGSDWKIEVSVAEGHRAEVVRYGISLLTPSTRELQRVIEAGVDGFAVGPYRILRFLRFYAENPAARQELAGGCALRRLRSV